VAHRSVIVVVALLIASGCGPAAPSPRALPAGGLVVVSDPPDAMLFVDDKYVGTVASLKGKPVMLAKGTHRIEVRRDGYFAHYAEVTVAEGVQQRLEVQLRQEPF